MFKVEQCSDLDCAVYYKPLQKVAKISLRNNKIRTLYTGSYRNKLIHLFTYKIQNSETKKEIIDYINLNNNLKDKEIYDSLIHILAGYDISEDNQRGEYRINTISRYINNWNNANPSFYLDIGCFQGDITKAIGSHFKLNKFQIHGIDIKQYVNTDEFIYTVYDGKYIPYNNESFDLITCFMVLHHVPTNNINILINEIFRVMKPGGLLLLREHNAHANDYFLLDVLHEYYDYVLNSSHTWEESKGYYNSAEYWAEKLISAGFEYNTIPNLRLNNPKNPFNNYIASFKKPEIVADQNDFFRILTPDFPREPYERRFKDKRNYIHWGQRKLLLSEIEFLCLFFKDKFANLSLKNNTKDVVVVYAGAAPGTHILILNDLFPMVKFILYDPCEFSQELRNSCEFSQKIEIYQELFTDAVCLDLKEKYKNDTILFISDIRTADITTMDNKEVEDHIINDQQLQFIWYGILNPTLSMLKFRLPWNDGITSYLDGDIYLQAYAPLSSTETRLIIAQDCSLRDYDNRLYEEQLFYFNKYLRDANYCIKDELLPFDKAVEKHILIQYYNLNLLLNFRSQDDSFVENFSDEISKRLSDFRTLTSNQPLSHSKKEMIKSLIKEGLVPSTIHYTIHDYNLYVLPIYDKIIARGL
jgi:ubiquinone/menaquinone biosynthesis C-methylase UbiE